VNNYVITYKDKVIYGPAIYNKGMFSYILASTEEIYNTELPAQLTEMLVVNSNLKVLPVGEEYTPYYNTKIEQLAGPYYRIKENAVDVFYEIAPQKGTIEGQVVSIPERTPQRKPQSSSCTNPIIH
jgi:hypothetical protein